MLKKLVTVKQLEHVSVKQVAMDFEAALWKAVPQALNYVNIRRCGSAAFMQLGLILKCFHSRDHCVLKLVFLYLCVPLLECSSRVWLPHHRYLLDKIELVQRFFTKKLSGLQNLTYLQRLKVLDLESLERCRLIFDLVLCYKIMQGLCNITLKFERGCTVTHGNMYKMSKQNCTIDATKYFLTTVLLMRGIVFQILLWLPHHSMILKKPLHSADLSKFLTIV